MLTVLHVHLRDAAVRILPSWHGSEGISDPGRQ